MFAPASAGRTAAGWSRFSTLTHAPSLAACREVSESVYPGLDLTDEIQAVYAQGFGDTVLVEGAKGIAGFAFCHHGPRAARRARTRATLIRRHSRYAVSWTRLDS
jgi:hypothetical protein